MGKSKAKSLQLSWFSWVTIGMVALLIGGGAFGANALMSRAREMRTSEPRVKITWSTWRDDKGRVIDWLPRQTKDDLTAMAVDSLSGDPLDQSSLSRVGARLMATGWFRSIDKVERRPGGEVLISATWRVPVAVVRELHVDRLVTNLGEVLPLAYQAGRSGLPVILGASQPAPEKMGDRWIGGDVQAGLDLLGYLSKPEYNLVGADKQAIGVDVTLYAKKRTLMIVTSSNARIVWGERPSVLAPAEVTPEVKVSRLITLKSSPDFGRRIDAGRMKIDVSSPRGTLIDAGADLTGVPSSSSLNDAGAESEPQNAMPAEAPVAARDQRRPVSTPRRTP